MRVLRLNLAKMARRSNRRLKVSRFLPEGCEFSVSGLVVKGCDEEGFHESDRWIDVKKICNN